MSKTTEKPESKAAAKRREKAEAIERLRRWIKPGDTIHTLLKHVSRSGMYRRIAVIVTREGEPWNISGDVSTACGMKWCDDGSVGVGGCGMDMGFSIVYDLSRTLWPDGAPCLGEGCPSNDHSNGMPYLKTYTAETCPGRPCGSECDHVGVPDVTHRDGGYTLRHRWL